MKPSWEHLIKKATSRVSGGPNEPMMPATITLFRNIVGFSQLDNVKGSRKCFPPETSAAVQLGADQNSTRKCHCSLRREQGSLQHAVLLTGG